MVERQWAERQSAENISAENQNAENLSAENQSAEHNDSLSKVIYNTKVIVSLQHEAYDKKYRL